MSGWQIVKKIWWIILALFFIEFMGVSLYNQQWLENLLGGILGNGVAILMFLQLARDMQTASELYKEKVASYIFSRYMLRYLLYGVTLFLSIRLETISMVTTILGLFSVKISILIGNKLSLWKEGN